MTWTEQLKWCALALAAHVKDEGPEGIMVLRPGAPFQSLYNPRVDGGQVVELLSRFHLELQWNTEKHQWQVRARVAAQVRGSGAAGTWSLWHRFVADACVEAVALHAYKERLNG